MVCIAPAMLHFCLWHCSICYMSKEQIRKKMKEQMPMLKKKYHVKKMGIFGSFAKGKQTKNSDIDILVEFNSPIGFFAFLEMENFLSKSLHRKVDLVSKKAVKKAVKKEILREVVYV